MIIIATKGMSNGNDDVGMMITKMMIRKVMKVTTMILKMIIMIMLCVDIDIDYGCM